MIISIHGKTYQILSNKASNKIIKRFYKKYPTGCETDELGLMNIKFKKGSVGVRLKKLYSNFINRDGVPFRTYAYFSSYKH